VKKGCILYEPQICLLYSMAGKFQWDHSAQSKNFLLPPAMLTSYDNIFLNKIKCKVQQQNTVVKQYVTYKQNTM